jgi:EAL domain-containing protein (putative c-di-GMP-specific phosphodiesterase class I)
VPDWAARLRELGFDGSGRLLLELDEAQLREPQLQALLQKPALQAAGVRLLLTDFGQGLAALSSLEHPGLSSLRLAAERVQLVASPRGKAWLQAVTGLSKSLGLQVQAGGVLDAEQQQALLALGVDALLGPGVAAPLDEEGFAGWLAQRAVGNP